MKWPSLRKPVRPPRSHELWLASLILCLLSTLDMLSAPFSFQFDFKSFYCAAAVAASGGNYYDIATLQTMAAQHAIPLPVWPYLYPPLFAEVAAPLGLWPVQSAQWLWMCLSMFAASATIVLTLKWAAPRSSTDSPAAPARQWLHLLAAFLVFHLLGFRHNLYMGQINIFVLLLIVSSLYAWRRGRDLLSGALLALAILIKMSPALLLLFFLFSRRARVVWAAAAASIALFAVSVFAFGMGPWKEFINVLPHLAPGKTVPGLFPPHTLYNFSLAGFFSRCFPGSGLVYGMTYLSASLLLAAAFLCTRKLLGTAPDLFLVPLLVIMVIAAPLAYIHHTLYIYPAVWLLLSRSLAGGKWSKIFPVLLLLAAAAASFDFPVRYPWYFSHFHFSPWFTALFTSLNLYALLFILLISCIIIKKSPPLRLLPDKEE